MQGPRQDPLQSRYACLRSEGVVPMALAGEFKAMLAEQMQTASQAGA